MSSEQPRPTITLSGNQLGRVFRWYGDCISRQHDAQPSTILSDLYEGRRRFRLEAAIEALIRLPANKRWDNIENVTVIPWSGSKRVFRKPIYTVRTA
jgi:hypothetical protein